MWKLALVTALLLTAAAAPSARAATCTPPTAGRVALWHGEDTTADSAGDFDGVLFGDAAYRDGKVGRAFSFPGDQDHMRVPSANALEVTGDVTLDAWVKLDDTNFAVGGDRAIFFKSDADDHVLTYALWIEGSDVSADAAPITFAAGDRSVPGSHAYSDPLAWKQDTWYHVAGVRSGRAIHFYRDGVPVGTDALGQDGIATQDAWLTLGAAPVGDTVFNPLKGALDEAEIWNRALGADEIAALGGHCGPRTRITAGPANGDEIKGDPTFSFESSEPVSTFHCFVRFPPGTIEPSKSFDCSSPTKLALGPAGTYTFHVAADGDPTGDQRSFRLLPPPPRNTARPSIVPLGDHTYRCDPGTWEGRDPARPSTFTWQRLTRDTSAFSGYRVDTVATGETYRAATEKQFDVLNASWLFQCVVTGANASGSTSATSPSLKLDPVYDPGLELPPSGNFRVRGIDVFQVVQPTAGAVTWDDPVAGAFPVECGGGTPTSWKLIEGTCSLGLEPPRFKRYEGVELDARKPTTAIVYVDMADAAPGQKLEVSLRLIRQGKPWDVPLRATITPPPAAGTPFVTAAERGDPKRGVPFALPAYWLCCTGGDRIDLKATVTFPKVFGQQPHQCASGCTDDDRYTLWGLPLVTAPPVRVESVDLRKVGLGAVDTWSAPPGTLLARARQIYPGGEGWSVFSSGATIDIHDVLGWTIDSPQCAFWKDRDLELRDCLESHIGARLLDWESRNRDSSSTRDILMGIHANDGAGDWTMGATGTLEEPQASWHPTAIVNNGDLSRPLTSAAHELGHAIGLPHAGRDLSLPVTPGTADSSCGGDSGAQAGYGEPWLPDDSGRLQGAAFDSTTGGPPVVDSNGTPLFDLMSYCKAPGLGIEANHWISPRNWAHALSALRTWQSKAAHASAKASIAVARQSAYAVGVVGPGGGQIERVVPPGGESTVPAAPASPVRLRSFDAQGSALGEVGVQLHPLIGREESPGASFAAPVPAAAAAVELVRDGKALQRLERSAAPRVRVLSPRRGQRVRRGLVVRWKASDPDHDALYATVDYSPDGGRTWTSVYQGVNTGRVRIPGRSLAGSRRARIRVGVNDGFNEPHTRSAAFRVDGTPPAARIVRPLQREPLRAGARTVLTGTALDDRHRELRGRALSWFAGHRRLGHGRTLTVRLPAGRTVLRLVARDRSGRRGAARLQVRVRRPALRLLRVAYQHSLPRRARTLTVRIAASERAILRAAGRRFRVGPRTRRVVLPLPRLRIKAVLTARRGRRVVGTIVVARR